MDDYADTEQPPAPGQPDRPGSIGEPHGSHGLRRVALIELFERDGRIGRVVDVPAWPLSVGRAFDNDVVLDDPWIAPHHLRVAPDAQGRLTLHALPSRNGVQHGKHLLNAGETLALTAAGATVQLGATRLRLRLPGEVLAEEKPMPGVVPGQRLQLGLIALALAALMLVSHWIELDPGADFSTWLPVLVALPVALAGWCGAWALLSKLFQHRFDFAGHLRIALPWLLALSAAEMLWPQAAAALASPSLWFLSGPLQGLLMALLVRAHLAHVLPLHQRAVTATVVALAAGSGILSLALTYRSSDSFAPAPYMSTLPPPAVRLGGTVPPQVLVQDIGALASKLAQRVKKARAEDDEASAEPDTGESE